jgi:hypothetical protein
VQLYRRKRQAREGKYKRGEGKSHRKLEISHYLARATTGLLPAWKQRQIIKRQQKDAVGRNKVPASILKLQFRAERTESSGDGERETAIARFWWNRILLFRKQYHPAGGLIFINFEQARREIFQDEIKLLRKFLSCRNALRKVARRHVVKTRARFPWSCGDAVWFVSERAHVCFSLERSHKTLLLLRFSKKKNVQPAHCRRGMRPGGCSECHSRVTNPTQPDCSVNC